MGASAEVKVKKRSKKEESVGASVEDKGRKKVESVGSSVEDKGWKKEESVGSSVDDAPINPRAFDSVFLGQGGDAVGCCPGAV